MSMIAVEAATTVVFVLIDPFFSKAKVFQSDSFFYFEYVRTEWVAVSNFNIDCFQFHVISSVGYVTNSQWPALQSAVAPE